MAGQLTITEMSVMIMLGAIVSAPMQLPDKGILQGVLILIALLVLQNGITWLSVKSEIVEKVTLGDVRMLVKDGVIQLDQMIAARISKQQLFVIVRQHEIYNLKKVKRIYIEACGVFSLINQRKMIRACLFILQVIKNFLLLKKNLQMKKPVRIAVLRPMIMLPNAQYVSSKVGLKQL